MKKTVLLALLLTGRLSASACVTCNRQVREAIFSSSFYPNLLAMLSAFIVLAVIIIVLAGLSTRRYRARLAANPGELSAVPLATAATVLGIGLGGFVDGIVLHQLMQWHEMLTAKMPPDTLVNKSVNMFWDGIFHAFTLLTTMVGVVLMWKLLQRKAINRSGYLFAGGLAAGWGLFNLVEGIIDHHILVLHNVRELSPHQDAWNYGFLGFGVLLLVGGWAWIRKGSLAGKRFGKED